VSPDPDRPADALLFPGQGVGDASAAELVRTRRPDLYELALELVAGDPFERIAEGTNFAQPAIYCASIASFERLGRPAAHAYAGHSLGEVAALAVAGAVAEDNGLRIAAERGRLMAEAGLAASEPLGMLAVGGDRTAALALGERTGLALANENSPEQFVLSGAEPGLEAAAAAARELGLRAKRLKVTGAFHSPWMQPAVEPYRRLLAGVEFRPAGAVVISGATATPFAADPRDQLVASLTSPVLWADVMRRLHADGARRFLDVGPGRVLAKLVPRILGRDEAEVEFGDREPARA
jgi:[acyl-carrier-protein] S-malonyltransferase